MRVTNAKVDYVNSLLDLVDKVEQSNGKFSYDAINDIIDDDIRKLIIEDSEEEEEKK